MAEGVDQSELQGGSAKGYFNRTNKVVVDAYESAIQSDPLGNLFGNGSGVANTVAVTGGVISKQIAKFVTTPASVSKAVDVSDYPEVVITAKREKKTSTLVFPDGLLNNGDVQNGPHVVIKAYEYKRKIDQQETNEPLYRIYLPMPPNITQGYQAMMDNFSGSIIADQISKSFGNDASIRSAMLAGAGSIGAGVLIGSLQNKVFGMFEHEKLGQLAQNTYNSAMSGDIRAQFSSISGLSINPRYEVSFSSMGLRKHNFTFTMVPISESESKNVNKIVKQLRYSAHPAETVGDFILSYPDKFIVEFRDQSGELIEALPHLPDCMIDGFEVNTTVGRMHKNDPVATIINISFTEQHTLTRKSAVIDY